MFRQLTRSLLILAVLALSGCSEETLAPPYKEPPNQTNIIVDRYPRWSPDGSRILYFHTHWVKTESGFYGVDLDSTGLWAVTSTGLNPTMIVRAKSIYGDWTSDGEGIIYEFHEQIFLAGLTNGVIDSTTITQLTTEGKNYFPAMSPDGVWIAYDSDKDSPPEGQKLWIMEVDGSNKSVFDDLGMGEWREPHWHPSGDKICHVRFPGGGTFSSEIYTIDIDGTTSVRVTDNQKTDRSPRYSPDGNTILYYSVSSQDQGVWRAKADGSESVRIVSGRDPSWSPTGDEMAFVFFSSDSLVNVGTIWVSNIDGSEMRQITKSVLR